TEPHMRAVEHRRAGAHARAHVLEAKAHEAKAAEAELVGARAALFDGEPVSRVRARLTSALEEARAGAADAAVTLAGAEVRATEAESRRRALDVEHRSVADRVHDADV